MSDEIDIQTAAFLSPDSKRKNFDNNNMPPEAEQTDVSETRQPPSVEGNHDTEKDHPSADVSGGDEVSSKCNDSHGEQDEKKEETELKEVTRVIADPDGTPSCHEDNGTSLNCDSRMPNGSPHEILISSNQDDDDNSVEDLLRDCQSVSTITSCKTKEPEGRLSRVPSDACLGNLLDMDEPTTERSTSTKGYPQCEPSPIRTGETNPKEIFRGKSITSDPISPVSFLETTAVDAIAQKQLEPAEIMPRPEPNEPTEATAQLLLQLQQGTSPPPPPPPPPPSSSSDHVPPGNNEIPTISEHQTMMQPVMETDESNLLSVSSHQRQILSPSEQQHLSSHHPSLPIIPTLPHLLPGPRGSLTQVGAPTPSPVSNGYHHHAHQQAMFMMHQQHIHTAPVGAPLPSSVVMPSNGGKRKIHLRLVEDVRTQASLNKSHRKTGSFLSFRRKKVHQRSISEDVVQTDTDRGRVTVSWYEGTSSLELQEHVRNTVVRKLGLSGTTKLVDMRILDESCDPPEEIVLSTYIPDGSRLLLRFATRDAGGDVTPPLGRRPSFTGGAPDSPSAAPSPYASSLDLKGLGLNPNQLALLGARLEASKVDPKARTPTANGGKSGKNITIVDPKSPKDVRGLPISKSAAKGSPSKSGSKTPTTASPDRGSINGKKEKDDDDYSESSTMEMNSLHPEDQIQKSLRQITELLVAERTARGKYSVPRQEKRQVVFVLANYFVLFLSLIAISAEIQARAPDWNASVEQYLKNVQTCSKDQDALFECVSNGDLAGLMASVVLWFSRSAATKRIFLFGFESPKKLWTVVYESLVTSICWGISYMFIRRGMNPDTSRNFLQKYWKDAIYGSLAGFNAAFLKHVLKNLIPQEAIEDALQDRQLKILSWLPSFS